MTNRLPEKLTALRKCYNYSLADVAVKLAVPVSEYMNWENGNSVCAIYQLQKIAELYNVPVIDLLMNTREVTLPKSEEVFSSVNIPFMQSINSDDKADLLSGYSSAVAIDNFDAASWMQPEEEETQDFSGTAEWPSATKDYTDDFGDTKMIPVGKVNKARQDYEFDDELFQETTVHRIIEDEEPVVRKPKTAAGTVKRTPVKREAPKQEEVMEPMFRKPLIIGIIAAAVVVVLLMVALLTRGGNDTPDDKNTVLALGDSGRLVLGERFSAYLDEDGNVTTSGQAPDTGKFRNVIQIAATGNDLYGLKKDGTVVTTGDSADISKWSDIVQICAGDDHIVGLKEDGTVECSGSSAGCSVSTWSDISEVFAGADITVGKKSDGGLVSAGVFNSSGAITSLKDVHSVVISRTQVAVINSDGTVDTYPVSTADTSNTYGWENVKACALGNDFAVGLTNSRKIVIDSANEDLKKTVETWASVRYVAARGKTLVAVDKNENIIGAGENTYGQYQGSSAESAGKQLEQVKNVNFSVTKTNVAITWDDVPHAEYYELVISTSPETRIKSVTNSASLAVDKLVDGTTYNVSITASAGKSKEYDDADPTVLKYTYSATAVPLKEPANVKASLKDTTLTVSWDAVKDADYYNVAIESMVQKVEGTSVKMDVSHMESGKSYTVYVTAMSNNTSKYLESPGGSATFKYEAPKVQVKTPLASPAGLVTNVNEDNTWTIRWNGVEHAASYQVTVGADGQNIYSSVVSGTTSVVIQDGLVNGKSYSITIIAIPGEADAEMYTNSPTASFSDVYTENAPEPTQEPEPSQEPETTPEPEVTADPEEETE